MEDPDTPKRACGDPIAPPPQSQRAWGHPRGEGQDLEQAGANAEPTRQAAQALAGARGQQGLEQTWAELEALKEKFSRLQEDYSSTQRSNRLLEEKLLTIAQTMAAERQALNQHVAELLERLIGVPGHLVPQGGRNVSAGYQEAGGGDFTGTERYQVILGGTGGDWQG
ncbi:hypothetical protein Y1Q_0009078 [Alligator mississippiensis]|uniref:Uncharacterized protein n=1 Tax=Alligator mississippiensis TaxID=8496 RepID=A0A151MUD6_ALLMI|nr:hypothetical protein Y1Q_0009078 [Alligator mississippiensis]